MRPASLIAGIFLGVIALAHVARLARGLELSVAGRAVPPWASFPAAALTGALSILVLRERRR